MKKKRTMEVLLMEDMGELGKAGQLIAVSPGYARNCLLPQARAAIPTKEALRTLDAKRKRDLELVKMRESELAALAEAIPATNVTLEMKSSSEGKLYGAVTAQMIADAMKRAGLSIHPQQVRLEVPIKEIGQFDVPIHVFGEVTVNARLWVVNQA